MKIRPTRILYAILSLAFILMMGMGHLSAKVTSPAITTLAGSGSAGFGDGTGSGASFKDPSALAVDTVGNVYVADTQNNRIRKITPAGVVSTLAGSGVAGFSDGKGKSASFKSPTGIALDSSGNVYVADSGNNRLRKITPAGVVTTLWSNTDSKFKPYGVALDSSGNIYVADKQNNKIHKITIPVFPSANMVRVAGGKLPKSSKLAGQVVASFEIGNYEVTWGEWKSVRDWAVNNNKGYDLAGVGDTEPSGSADNFPVCYVSWYDVVKWSNARSEKEGKTPVYKNGKGGTYKTGEVAPTLSASANGYRLPSEKEWEWAARGGLSSQGYTYSGSNTVSDVAWTTENSSYGTKAVVTKAANELGIYDMSGNVREWCFDLVGTSSRRIRGGSWDSFADNASVAYRDINYYPGGRDGDFGFRLARSSGN